MNICMILNEYFPPDIRIEKEVRSLIEAGHNIYLLSLGKIGAPYIENVDGINVIRILPPRDFINKVTRLFWFNLFFENIFWERNLEYIIKQYKINIIHIHDLPLVKTSVIIAKKLNIPIIADLHENFPEAIRTWRKIKMPLKNRLFNLVLPVWRWKIYEKNILNNVDKIITVVNESKEHYINDCKIPSENITVVMNVEDLEEFYNLKIDENLIIKYKNNFIISYIGNFGPHRGIDIAISAMHEVLEDIPNAKLLLVGKGPKEYKKRLDKLCKELKIRNNVEFTDWVDFSLVPSYIALSNICLVPHNASGHTNTTVPHKLFQYMVMKKPVIVTDCKPLKRIVEECNCGMIFPSGDYSEMAKIVVKLFKNSELAKKFGENGRKAVEEKYNWGNEEKKLCKLYEKLKNEYKLNS